MPISSPLLNYLVAHIWLEGYPPRKFIRDLNNDKHSLDESQSHRLSLARVVTWLRELTEAKNALEALVVGEKKRSLAMNHELVNARFIDSADYTNRSVAITASGTWR
jgi:hypothetical protein